MPALVTIRNGQFQDAAGTLQAGTLVLQLPQDAVVSGTGQVAPKSISIAVTAGQAAATPIWGTDNLSPAGLVYVARLFDGSGALVWGPENWAPTGVGPIEINTLVPASSSVAYVAAEYTANKDAANGYAGLTAGTLLKAAEFPAPSSTTFGGVKSKAAVAHNFLNAIGTDGIPTAAQPAVADLSDGSTGTGQVVLATSPTIATPTISSPTVSGTAALPIVTLTGKVTNYNAIATVANGIPSEVAAVDLTVQAASIGTTTLYAVPASGAGQYRISWNAKVTQAATTSSTLGPLTITYTDPDGVVVAITATGQNSSGTVSTAPGGNTTGVITAGFPLMLNCKASTNIQYAFTYASSGATPMQYNLHIKVEVM